MLFPNSIERIFVTGATGFIGQRLLQGLMRKVEKASVRVLSRQSLSGFETVVCDLQSDAVPEKALVNIDTVYHLAGYAHDLQDGKSVAHLYQAVNVDATVRLAQMAASSGVQRFVFVSSVKAGGSAVAGRCVTEADQLEPEGIYGRTKSEAELKVLEIGRQSGMHVSIVRPSLVYGPGVKGNLALMQAGATKDGRGWLHAMVKRLYAHALNRVDKVFFQNPDDMTLFRGLGILSSKVPVVVVNGSGVDVENFKVTPIPVCPPHFLLIARLLGDKGVREYAEVRPAYTNPTNTWQTNAIGTINVLESLRLLKNPCVAVLITSDKCYDNVEWVWGYRETDALGGPDPYSASKGAAELAIRSYVRSFFPNDGLVRIGVGRAGNVIGGGDWAEDRIVPDCMRAWSRGETVQLRNPLATRPWQHVLEPLSGYLNLAIALKDDSSLHGEPFNFGPPAKHNHTVGELVSAMGYHWNQVRWEDVSDNHGGPYESGLL